MNMMLHQAPQIDHDDIEASFDRFTRAVAIADEHVGYCIACGDRPIEIARMLHGFNWTGSFEPTRGELVESYARAWLGMGFE